MLLIATVTIITHINIIIIIINIHRWHLMMALKRKMADY